jgi:hypothetical protein
MEGNTGANRASSSGAPRTLVTICTPVLPIPAILSISLSAAGQPLAPPDFFSRGRRDEFHREKRNHDRRILASSVTELHPTSPSDRSVVHPVSCPIGCVMIQSLPARAGRLYGTMTQFLRELPETMRQRVRIRDYH